MGTGEHTPEMGKSACQLRPVLELTSRLISTALCGTKGENAMKLTDITVVRRIPAPAGHALDKPYFADIFDKVG
jgi:hypothetical protein